MSHTDLAIDDILKRLPEPHRSTLQQHAIARGIPMVTLIQDGLVEVAKQLPQPSPSSLPLAAAGARR